MTANSGVAHLSEVLCRLSSHLDALAGQIFDVEQALGELLEGEPSQKKISLTKFQSLDFARQSLEDCALLLSLIGETDTARTSFDREALLISKKLKLDTTQGIVELNMPAQTSIPRGEVDLF